MVQNKCRRYWKNPNFNFTFCANQNRTASHLCTWMQACVMASELMDGIRDFQRELYGDVSNTEAPPTEDCDEDEGEDSTKHDEHERFHSQAKHPRYPLLPLTRSQNRLQSKK